MILMFVKLVIEIAELSTAVYLTIFLLESIILYY